MASINRSEVVRLIRAAGTAGTTAVYRIQNATNRAARGVLIVTVTLNEASKKVFTISSSASLGTLALSSIAPAILAAPLATAAASLAGLAVIALAVDTATKHFTESAQNMLELVDAPTDTAAAGAEGRTAAAATEPLEVWILTNVDVEEAGPTATASELQLSSIAAGEELSNGWEMIETEDAESSGTAYDCLVSQGLTPAVADESIRMLNLAEDVPVAGFMKAAQEFISVRTIQH